MLIIVGLYFVVVLVCFEVDRGSISKCLSTTVLTYEEDRFKIRNGLELGQSILHLYMNAQAEGNRLLSATSFCALPDY